MIHQSQGLALGFKPRQDLPGIHARFDHFERDPAANGFFLFSQVNDPAAPLSELSKEPVAAHAFVAVGL
jgi:hypothetical protein